MSIKKGTAVFKNSTTKCFFLLTFLSGSLFCVQSQENAFVGYLVEQTAGAGRAYSSVSPFMSGWEMDKSGGDVSGFTITDNSNSAGVSLTRKFLNQTSDKIVLEYRFNANTKVDGMTWQLRSGNTIAVNILTSGGNLCYENSSGLAVSLLAYDVNKDVGVKVIADISTNKADIYINGRLLASDADFRNSVSNLDCFYLFTGTTGTVTLIHRGFFIYKGYVVNERFLSQEQGILPDDWSTNMSGGTDSVIKNEDAGIQPDCYSARLSDTSGSNSVSMTKAFAPQNNIVEFEYRFMLPVKQDGFTAKLNNDSISMAVIVTDNGNLCYLNSSQSPISVWDNYLSNVWYYVRVTADLDAHTADIYINDIKRATGVSLANTSISSVNLIYFATSASNTSVVWLDDIQVYPYQSYPSDYVPSPIPVPHGNYQVGVQVCNLWREGSHFGWDWISSDADRVSILGCYDEGNPEVADWETKFMVDHGIDFIAPCWYRPRSGTGQSSFKDGVLSAGLNGYKRSKYSNSLKYMLLIETMNAPMQSMDDWKYNTVPFLMEHYFKDPRYLVIDNKPVAGFFGGIRNTGDNAVASDYLNTKCIEAGFSGVTLLGCTTTGDVGFEYNFTYCQLFSTENTPNRISSPSVNWDRSAWEYPFQNKGYWRSTATYKTLLSGQKSLMPNKTGIAKNMLLLGNWNEYGEGHFIMPTEGLGYGYLDVIREVFGDSSAHTDITPTDEQKARINVLYEKKVYVTPPPDSTDVTIANSGFELPVISTLQYGPTGAGWTFAGGGIQRNLSAFQACDAPEGVQTAFLQRTCTVSQTVSFDEAGSYVIIFMAAKRTSYGGNQIIDVTFDSSTISTLTPSTCLFVVCSTSVFTASVGEHVIAFSGTTSDDNTAFIDNVFIKKTLNTPACVNSGNVFKADLAVSPNPFNPSTKISYGLSLPQTVELAVFDMSGRLVRLLVSKEEKAGMHSVEWNGCDQQDRLMSSGVYLIKLKAENKEMVRRAVLIR